MDTKEYKHRNYLEHREKQIAQSREWRKNNRERFRESTRRRRRYYKEMTLQHYGNGELKCTLCGETRLPALSIDHINGGGTKERKRTGLIGYTFYKWLRDNNFPEGYRTLCMNCQFVEKDKIHKAAWL